MIEQGHGSTDRPSDPPLLQTVGLSRHFRIGGLFGKGTLHAVDGVNLEIREREIVAVVGESGSGKSTLALLLAKVHKPTNGDILFNGRPLSQIHARSDLLAYRSQVPMVFQDPFSSLNPAHKIGYALNRGLKLHQPSLSSAERDAEAVRALESVGLTPARQTLDKFPHEMSGGQRQRVGFAQALSYHPKLVLGDEPVSMLDVSIRIGLLNLMVSLCEEGGLSFLYITHDIASARYVSHRVVVMYAGMVVESGPTESVLHRPVHPYTQLLMSAVPDPRARITVSAAETGEPPRVVDPGEGCRFRWRCALAVNLCGEITPLMQKIDSGHATACHVKAPAASL